MKNSGPTARACAPRPPRLHSTTRAIRRALAISATALFLQAGVANAGAGAPVVDLTRIDGDTPASVVAPSSPPFEAFAADLEPALAPGSFYLYNDDDLVLVDNDPAVLIDAQVYDDGASAGLVNVGSLSAISHFSAAAAVYLTAHGYDGLAYVDNDGAISAQTRGDPAFGVIVAATGYAGDASVTNGGSIAANSRAYAAGVVADALKYATVDNHGSISASAVNNGDEPAYAFAVQARTLFGNATVDNDDAIEAHAEGSYAFARAVYANSYFGHSYVRNSGDVAAGAVGEDYARAIAVLAASDANTAIGYNHGSVVAQADAGIGAAAVGLYAGANEFSLVNNYAEGSILAEAHGGGSAFAAGAMSYGTFGNVINSGDIEGVASADGAGGAAHAYGAIASGAFSFVYVYAGGNVSAQASGDYALAAGVLQYGSFTGFRNGGDVVAHAVGDAGTALGARVVSYYGITAYNDGEIVALAEGAGVDAFGFAAYAANGDLTLKNYGELSASGDHEATAVWLASDKYTSVYNHGSIVAEGGAASIAVDTSFGDSSDYLLNYGALTGAVHTGTREDHLYNAGGGTWTTSGASSFGDGDDHVLNKGTIHLVDAALDLGAHGEDGNSFVNRGLITIDGDNAVDMGGGAQTLVPAANPQAFVNLGTIDLQDGEADDSLAITGDFDGHGHVFVDVAGEQSDQLLIDGSVVAGSSSLLHVDLLALPQDLEARVPIVTVSGESPDDAFVLAGGIDFDPSDSFVALDIGLVKDDGVFALQFDATGLTDAGALAVSLPGAVRSLANAQVGSWRQRMGVIAPGGTGLGLWARAWRDKGNLRPAHHADFAAEALGWRQSNGGLEAGLDFAFDELRIGVLLGQAQADTRVGAGTNDIGADTWGLYATWISPRGFYLDASYRWMDFDVDLAASIGARELDGDARTLNVELGHAWTLSGKLRIEPQLQYTRTTVDGLGALATDTGMSLRSDGGDSSRARVGVALLKDFGDAQAGWRITPHATLSMLREFDGESHYRINDSLSGEVDLSGSSAQLELGFGATHRNWSLDAGLNWQDGGAIDGFFGAQVGLRYAFE